MAITRRRKAARKLRGVKKKEADIHIKRRWTDRHRDSDWDWDSDSDSRTYVAKRRAAKQSYLLGHILYMYVSDTHLRTCLRKGAAMV